jgi:transcriptional regulator
MYLRPVHTDLHLPTLYKFIRSNPLGIITTAIPSPNYHTIQSSHVPWVLDADDEENATGEPKAKLRGHMARANPQTKALIEAATKTSSNKIQEEVLILFNGPVHHYVTPKFYVETKPSTGKVVPTWDYSAVQVYGTATIFYDTSSPETDAYLSKQIDDLSKQSEEKVFGYTGKIGAPKAWNVGEAPESYVGLMKKAIIGIEIEVTNVAGKFKMSQELADGDRLGVIKGFQALGTEEGDLIAKTVKERGELKDAQKA